MTSAIDRPMMSSEARGDWPRLRQKNGALISLANDVVVILEVMFQLLNADMLKSGGV